MRISELVKGQLRREAASLLSSALRNAIQGLWTIGEAKNLPLESKLSEIRENIALALSNATGQWVVPYAVESLAREDKSPRCRLELVRQTLRRNTHVSKWLNMLSEIPWLTLWENEKFDRVARLREIVISITTVLRETCNNLTVDETTGPALATMIQKNP